MTNQNQLAIIQRDITDSVNNKIAELQSEGLALPPNYSHSNALKSAFFKLQEVKDKSGRPALEVCTKESIANALLDMVVQGLSPAKTQCYFVVYGTQLQMLRSYFGTQAVLKRLNGVNDIWANVIYKDDVFEYENDRGREKLISHKTAFENRDKDVIGAYAVIQTADGEEIMTAMTRKEIETSWGQSKTGQAVHKKFPGEMAKRTVINRAAKAFINTSDDSDLLIEAINNTTENEYEDRPIKEINPQQEINEKANKEELDFTPEPTRTVDAETGEIEPEPIQQEIYSEPMQQKQAVVDGPGW